MEAIQAEQGNFNSQLKMILQRSWQNKTVEMEQFYKKGLKKGIRFFLFNFSSRFCKKSNITSIYFLGKNFFNGNRKKRKSIYIILNLI